MISSNDKGCEEGDYGTNKNRQSDSLQEYLDKEPMTQVKINPGEHPTVKGDINDHKAILEGHSRMSTEQASEEYQKNKYTKIENDS
jgi:hypothetical protein